MNRRTRLDLRMTATIGALVGLAFILLPHFVRAQSSDANWEKAAGGKMSFEVASVKPGSGPAPSVAIFSNFVLGYGDNRPPSGLLTATNVPLFDYIAFAYKLDLHQTRALAAQMPNWWRQIFFDVEARPAVTDLTRDQVRLMMQSLLADRFKLAAHFETKDGPAYALVMAKAGKLGPQMRTYPDGFPCSDVPQAGRGRGGSGRGGGGLAPIVPTVDDGRFPSSCGQMGRMTPTGPGLHREGGRDISMESIVAWVGERLDRTLIDRTGLTGTFDVSVEFDLLPPSNADAAAGPSAQPTDPLESSFLEAANGQLGLKVQSITAPVDTLIIDHVEQPSPN